MLGRSWFSSPRSIFISGLALFALTLLAYLPAIRGEFLWDDDALSENPAIRSANGLLKIWTDPGASPKEDHYWPLVYTTFWIEYRIWGLHPLGYHLVNVGLHALNALLLGMLLSQIGVRGAELAAIIFAMHPVHVESVAWIIERKDTLSAMFYLLAALAFFCFERQRDKRAFALVFFLLVCAMLSKSIVVTFPLALAIWLWGKSKTDARLWLAVFVLLFLAATMTAGDLTVVRHQQEKSQIFIQDELSLAQKTFIASRAVWFYAGKLLWPANLMAVYSRWNILSNPLAMSVFTLATATVILLLWLRRAKLGRAPLAGILFFCITLGPVMGIIPHTFMRHSYVADRFQYLASIGLIALISSAGHQAIQRFGRIGTLPRGMAELGGMTFILALSILTWRQSATYHDTVALFRHNLAKRPDYWSLRYNLGLALKQSGKTEKAIVQYREAIRLNPDEVRTYNNLANALAEEGKIEEAVEWLEKAVRRQPDFPEAHFNLGNDLVGLGRLDEARIHFEEALRLKPDWTAARESLERIGLARLSAPKK